MQVYKNILFLERNKVSKLLFHVIDDELQKISGVITMTKRTISFLYIFAASLFQKFDSKLISAVYSCNSIRANSHINCMK